MKKKDNSYIKPGSRDSIVRGDGTLKDFDEMVLDSHLNQMDELKEGLKKSLYAFNDMPNTTLTNGTTTYELASKIEQLLK